jgi:hypothetical protein
VRQNEQTLREKNVQKRAPKRAPNWLQVNYLDDSCVALFRLARSTACNKKGDAHRWMPPFVPRRPCP